MLLLVIMVMVIAVISTSMVVASVVVVIIVVAWPVVVDMKGCSAIRSTASGRAVTYAFYVKPI